MTAEKLLMPNMPRLDMVKVPPWKTSVQDINVNNTLTKLDI